MRKQVLLMAAMLLMVVNNSWGQAPAIQWAKCYGGTNDDELSNIHQTNDGGYIVIGQSLSTDGNATGNHGGYDNWVVKLNISGALQWQKSLGGTLDDWATSIQQTTDGGYIVAGYTQSNNGNVTGLHGYIDYCVVKLNDTGAIQWQKCLGGTENDQATSIQQTLDGGYIVLGSSKSNNGDVSLNHGGWDYWIVKLNATGVIQWQKSLGGSADDLAYSIQQTTDGGYIIVGGSYSNDGDLTGNHGLGDEWVVKLNDTGTIQWQKSLGGSVDEGLGFIQQTTDGGYIVACFAYSNDGDISGHHGTTNEADYWIVKLDGVGAIQWQKSLGGTLADAPNSIQQTTDGGYIITGSTRSNDGDVTGHHGSVSSTDFWVVKIDVNGNLKWQKSLGGTNYDWAYSIQQTTDDGYIVAGISKSNDSEVVGHLGNVGRADYWVVKLAKDSLVGISELPASSISIFPNPTTGSITIKGITQPSVAVYNLMGQKVVSNHGSNEVSLANLPTGMYLVQVYSKDGALVKSEKIIRQ